MSKIKHKNGLQLSDTEQENIVFSNISIIIEKRKFNAVSAANSQIILMFWEIGKYINSAILGMERAEYGKKILSTVSTKLVENYGNPFVEANLYRMKRFATVFSDIKTIANFIPFLSWSHFCEIMRIKDEQARLYYAKTQRNGNLVSESCDNKLHENLLSGKKLPIHSSRKIQKYRSMYSKTLTC